MSVLRRRSPADLRCREVARVLQSFLDGDLDDVDAFLVRAHLEQCRRCGMDADLYEQMLLSLRRHGASPDPGSLARMRAFARRLIDEEP